MLSGIGGFEISMQEKDWECAGYSEIDRCTIQVYQRHFRDDQNYEDKNLIRYIPGMAGRLVFPCSEQRRADGVLLRV